VICRHSRHNLVTAKKGAFVANLVDKCVAVTKSRLIVN